MTKIENELQKKFRLVAVEETMHSHDWHLEEQEIRQGRTTSQDEIMEHYRKKPRKTGRIEWQPPDDLVGEELQYIHESSLISHFLGGAKVGNVQLTMQCRRQLLQLGYSEEAVYEIRTEPRLKNLEMRRDNALAEEKRWQNSAGYEGECLDTAASIQREIDEIKGGVRYKFDFANDNETLMSIDRYLGEFYWHTEIFLKPGASGKAFLAPGNYARRLDHRESKTFFTITEEGKWIDSELE